LGILIRGVEALESARRVGVILLDKTGTVTTGRMAVAAVQPAGAAPGGAASGGEASGGEASGGEASGGEAAAAAEVLRLAGAVEAASEHPLGRAITETARARGPLPAVTDFRATAGVGVQGCVEGAWVEVMTGKPPGVAAALRVATWVEVRVNGTALGWIALADTVRPSSAAAVADLRRLGLEPMLVTGDSAEVAEAVAAEVGITEVVAAVSPAGKVDVVKQLQARGRAVAMVGDGVNDAAALAQADLGLAMGAGTDVAIQASDLTLVRGDLTAAVDAVRLSRRTLGIIRGNLFWAFAYNVAALPLAAAGLLNPMIAGAAMALSSVFVVLNSLRLRRFQQAGTA
ncbi:MAG: HAD-IC family P-type ATPase, partial [Actinoplanes sp.]